jgi:hypothetical protein
MDLREDLRLELLEKRHLLRRRIGQVRGDGRAPARNVEQSANANLSKEGLALVMAAFEQEPVYAALEVIRGERAGGLRVDIRTRTEGYYERLGASRSLGFRLTREDLGLSGTAAG